MRHIVGLGGGGTEEQINLLFDYVLALTGKERPRLMFVPTASAERGEDIAWFFERNVDRADVTVLRTFPWAPADARERILAQDAIFVGGGNTANMLAIWKVHGIDTAMREAWEKGVVLAGWSAGMICWFEHGITDSFGPQLESMECLGFLAGSACPHYDGEERRRPRYRELLQGGMPAGLAADDGVGLHFAGTELVEAVTCRPGAAAYRVSADSEQPIETRLLASA
ncbi:MAG TPA: peptidase E [Gaiellaceae bacterium]|nr:peptidase E [Gaiellaceae bacterium]